MSNRLLCKFFLHGACLKGEFCEFSHDWKDPVNDVCTFYQRGICSYGSRCRYKHVNLSRPQSYASSSSTNYGQSSETVSGGVTPIQGVPSELSASSKPFSPKSKPAWSEVPEHHVILEGGDAVETRSVKSAEHPICSFAAAGNCPRGEKCPHIHGDLCPSCGKHCLHPFRPEEREEHMETCEKKQKHLDALKHSQEIECSVCLERVLSKPTAAERKFGLLSECDHPFCISCIRNWRSSSPTSGMDVNSALRACPICRKLSYFVIPSVIWYTSKEEKLEITDSYKAKLKSIDCKHFDFGNGTCPFGTSCFYKHTVKPGSYAWNNCMECSVKSNSYTWNSRMADKWMAGEGLGALIADDSGNEDLAFEDAAFLLMLMGLEESDDNDEDNVDNNDEDDFDELTPEQMAFLKRQLGYSSSDEQLFIF